MGSFLDASFVIGRFLLVPDACVSTTPRGACYGDCRDQQWLLHSPHARNSDPCRCAYLRKQFAKWMDALVREGFHFMLLSDVIRQLNQGKPIPEKTAVIVFDPVIGEPPILCCRF